MTLQVGQTLWFVPSQRRGAPYEITVSKVGRKWAEVEKRRMRINIETIWADGGEYPSPGRAYLSKAERDAEESLAKTWERFRRLMDHAHQAPAKVRESQIENAARALFGQSVLDKQPGQIAGDPK